MGSLLFRLSACYLRRTSPAVGILRKARFSNCCTSDESSSASPPSRMSPWLMLPPSKDGGGGGGDMLNYNLYSPAHNKVVCIRGGGDVAGDGTKLVGSSHGWLALFNERSLALFLWNPVSRRRINLPPIQTLPNPKGGLSRVAKVIVSSSPDAGDCRVVMSYGTEERLAFCCPGHSSEWTPIGAWYHDEDNGRKTARVYEDFAYSRRQNRLFCITQFLDLERWDLEDLHSPRIDGCNEDKYEEDEEINREVKYKYVVVAEQSNEVFVVERKIMEQMGMDGSYVKGICYDDDNYHYDDSYYPYKTVGFDVYKIEIVEEEEDCDGKVVMRLPYVEGSLNGLAMFVGINHSVAFAAAADDDELKADSIYFTDPKELTPCGGNYGYCGYGGHDIGIFDYKKHTFSTCYYPSSVRDIGRITPAPFWFTPTPH